MRAHGAKRPCRLGPEWNSSRRLAKKNGVCSAPRMGWYPSPQTVEGASNIGGRGPLTCGVEVWRGGLGAAYLFPTLSVVGASIAGPFFRFHTPLIEPDRPISGIRLSEKGSRCRPRDIARPLGKADEAQQLMQGCVRKPLGPQSPHFVLGAQPLTQPLASVLIHGPIGFADWP